MNDTETFVQLHKATEQLLIRDGKEKQHKTNPGRFTCGLKDLSGWILVKGKLSDWLPLLGPGESARGETRLFRIAAKRFRHPGTLSVAFPAGPAEFSGREGWQVPGSEKVRLPGSNRLMELLLELMVTWEFTYLQKQSALSLFKLTAPKRDTWFRNS